MNRKEFIKTGCGFCMSGLALSLAALSGCAPAAYQVFKAEPVNNMLEIPLQLFEKGNMQLVRPKGWQYDIAVQKHEDGTYAALLLQCTHMDNQLNVAQNGFACSLHGSRFNKDGNVLNGPAEIPLKKFPVTISNNNIIIKI